MLLLHIFCIMLLSSWWFCATQQFLSLSIRMSFSCCWLTVVHVIAFIDTILVPLKHLKGHPLFALFPQSTVPPFINVIFWFIPSQSCVHRNIFEPILIERSNHPFIAVTILKLLSISPNFDVITIIDPSNNPFPFVPILKVVQNFAFLYYGPSLWPSECCWVLDYLECSLCQDYRQLNDHS